jgi:hypothetical protein
MIRPVLIVSYGIIFFKWDTQHVCSGLTISKKMACWFLLVCRQIVWNDFQKFSKLPKLQGLKVRI